MVRNAIGGPEGCGDVVIVVKFVTELRWRSGLGGHVLCFCSILF